MSFNIIPGEGRYIGGKSYFIVDEEALPGFLEEVFSEEPETSEEAVVDKSVSIEILNSTSVAGAAARARDELAAKGYSVSEIGNHRNAILDTTMIYAKDESLAQQFLNYYPNAIIETQPNLPYDIQIILGNDSVTP